MKKLFMKIPNFYQSHWLLRVPLAIVFIQQGWWKMPINTADAESYGLSYLTWWVVTYGEFLSGIGLLVGGFLTVAWMYDMPNSVGDIITRFSGITMCCIMTGVIWIGDPESILDVLFYDNLHVLLWMGGLYFALRGNRI
tara:strand:- start:403 stop:819 length:417 start_codon:yes stop_codon:yes gene_type:complete